MFDWNDLRHFLAVARDGSTLAAARALRVSQTTVARRVAALEAALGVPLFERRAGGYAATPAAEALRPAAEEMERAAAAVADQAAAQRRETGGVVRLSTHEIYAVTVLLPVLAALRRDHPLIRVEVDAAEEMRDLVAGEADIGLRALHRLEGGGLVGRHVGADAWTVYCSRAYAAAHGRPANRAQLHGHPLIAGGGGGMWRSYAEWLRANRLEEAVAMHHGSAAGLLAAVRAGVGLTVLPTIVGDAEPALVRCLPSEPIHRAGLWLMVPERLRHTPRMRIVLDAVFETLSAQARASAAVEVER